MPPRRTSPRRSATRPSAPLAQFGPDDDYDEPGRLAAATPWMVCAALIIPTRVAAAVDGVLCSNPRGRAAGPGPPGPRRSPPKSRPLPQDGLGRRPVVE